MARRKGKSRYRIRNWQQRLHDGADIEDGAPIRQKLTRRAVKLPPERLAAPEENLDGLPKAKGMVVGCFPGGVIVDGDGGQLLCGIAKTYRAPEGSTVLAVGDLVTVALTSARHGGDSAAADKDRADGMVIAREPRETALSRPTPRSGKRRGKYGADVFEKVIVANMDVLLIVASTCLPPLRHGLIDRYLIIAERGELAPILAVNKIDLGKPDEQVLGDFAELGIEIHTTSAETGEGVPGLVASLQGKRTVLAGASGAGKSTLINAMIPGAGAQTGIVNIKEKRGRHTTSAAAIYELPGGGLIVDTPGVRELGIRLEASELPWYFPEFEAVAPDCKFRNCTHTHEPECAVLAGLEAGEILARRYESYRRILDTLSEH